MGYIYMLIDKRNGKKYVGKHNGNKKNYWSGGIIPNKIKKIYGKDIFKRVILEDGILEEELNNKEIYYINKYNTLFEGYNLTKGGDGGDWTIGKTHDEIKEIMTRVSNSQKGKVISEEIREKMSVSGKKKFFTKKHKKNISKSLMGKKGRKHSEETKEKIRNKRKGTKNPKHKKFMQENNPKAQKVSIDGVIYKTIKEASDILNIPRHIVKNRLNSEKNSNWFKIK